ncbi:hypothetical protein A1O1_08948 [Capronia coronata CBS 617.96]|uniref:Uncharacterized protein n=1 Tax=Capronia coronata CBS 617.96 TaxID=1182541 RepID=W9XDK1_9EURO|nr:uncharacterized protein A1O1_08948 [Capronia coronata CBS 617.96]EXJ78547.1 hypothetical protein A1O1_08948 [Capronia coronata CBS 617.96]
MTPFLYSFADFFPWNDHLPAVQDALTTSRSAFAIDYTYCSRTGELTISGVPGGLEGPRSMSETESTSHTSSESPQTMQEEPLYQQSESGSESPTPAGTSHTSHVSHSSHLSHTKYANTYNISALLHASTLPYTSAPFIVRAKAGDQDGINLPSFAEADATLLFWEIHKDVAEIPLRVRVVNESTVQIWPESKFWDADRAKGLRKPKETPTTFPPLLSITFNTTKTKPWADRKTITTVVDTFVPFRIQLPNTETESNSSPSQTFMLRRAISALIVPVGLFLNEYIVNYADLTVVVLLRTAQFLCCTVGIYLGVVLVCWKIKGSPPYHRFIRSFWLTRPMVVFVVQRDSEYDLDSDPFTTTGGSGYRGARRYHMGSEKGDRKYEHVETRSQQEGLATSPKPLTCLWDFVSSRSPLDDLLVTFEATRGFVRPLGVQTRMRLWRRESRRGPIDDNDGTEEEERETPRYSSPYGDDDDDEESRLGGIAVEARARSRARSQPRSPSRSQTQPQIRTACDHVHEHQDKGQAGLDLGPSTISLAAQNGDHKS